MKSKFIKKGNQIFKGIHIILLLFLIVFTSCNGQKKENIVTKKAFPNKEKIKILADSISIPAENLPEFKTDPHIKESQGNQISGVVRTMLQDKNKNFWFGTQNGLSRYDGQSLVYFDIKNLNGKSITIKAIAEDKTGNLWIGHSDGITKYDGTYFINYTENDGLISNDVWSITTDRNGTVWIGTLQGACSFDGEKFSALALPKVKPDPTRGVTSDKIVHNIMEDSQGQLWFSTNGGAYIYNGNTITGISEKDGLCNDYVNQTVEDSKGNIWFATAHNGLCYYNGTKYTPIEISLFDKDISIGSVIEDSKGIIWFNADKRNLYSYNGKELTKHTIEIGDSSPGTFQIYEDQQQRLWFVGFKGAYRFDGNSFVNITRKGPW